MRNAVGKYGVQLVFAAFVICCPAAAASVTGQDLGSTSGIFRAANPATTKKTNVAPTEKKNAPTKKAATGKAASRKPVSKTSATVKRNPPKSVSKQNSGGNAIVSSKPPAKNGGAAASRSLQNNIVITVGKPATAGGESEEQFDLAIEEGNQARDERNYVAAEVAYRRAQNLKSKDSRSIYGLGNIYSDQQRWEEAETAYRQAVGLDPESPEAHIALSFVLSQPILTGVNLSERYAEAEQMARRAIQLDPGNAIAYDQLGTALELTGRIGVETESAYRRAIALDSNFALAYAHLGRLLRRQGKAGESASAYRDAVRLATDVPTMILVADVMQSQQRYAESEDLLRRALAADPKNPSALFLLGRALTTGGKFDEAEKYLKKSVEISPNNFVSYTLLGSLYARRGIYDQAEKVLQTAARVVSPNERKRLAQEFEFIGDGLMRVGKKADAARVYRQAISLDAEKNELTAKLNKAEKN